MTRRSGRHPIAVYVQRLRVQLLDQFVTEQCDNDTVKVLSEAQIFLEPFWSTSYESSEYDRFEAFSVFGPPVFDYKREIYKDYAAPIFRRCAGGFRTDPATFGMVPRKRIPPGVKVFDTMNARTKSVGKKRSFSGAWKKLQLCLIPCASFYEPNYETGKPVRWKIGMASG
jgi:putative SOS response-associated peptidase YedK